VQARELQGQAPLNLLKQFLNILRDLQWTVGWRVPLDRLSFTIQQEFAKVPLDVLGAHDAREAVLQPNVQRMCTRSVDIDLAEHGELDTILGCKLLDICLWLRLLFPELVARKGQNLEALCVVLIVQGDELLVVLVGQASFGRDVDHQRHLSDELGEVPGLPVDVHGGEVLQRRRRRAFCSRGGHGVDATVTSQPCGQLAPFLRHNPRNGMDGTHLQGGWYDHGTPKNVHNCERGTSSSVFATCFWGREMKGSAEDENAASLCQVERAAAKVSRMETMYIMQYARCNSCLWCLVCK